PVVVAAKGARIGVIVCEDAWVPEPAASTLAAGAEAVVVINGSPFHMRQQMLRERIVGERAAAAGVPFVYLNMVGGQDELVFDGGSIVLDAAGDVRFRAPLFEEGLHVVELRRGERGRLEPVQRSPQPPPSLVERVYGALVLGTRDYVEKNGFPGVVLGLSGGVDSALTLAIAVDAIGAQRVHAVM